MATLKIPSQNNTEKWFKNFGWKGNPFEIRPLSNHLTGFVDLRVKILSYIHAGSPLLLVGPTGSGKTTVLKWFEREKKAIYVNPMEHDPNEIKRKITGLNAKLKKFFGQKNIVLVDEAHGLPSELSEWLRTKFDGGEIDSLVLAVPHEELFNLSFAFLDRIGARRVEMRKITEEEAFQMVKQRIFSHGNEIPFTNQALKKIFEISDYHPRKILENCERCCIHASWSGLRYIDEDFVKKILGVKKSPEPKSLPKNETTQREFKLSRIQQKILDLLSEQNLTTQEIAQKLGISRASAAKQISRLMLRTDRELMLKKGITSPLIEPKNKGRPVMYGLINENDA